MSWAVLAQHNHERKIIMLYFIKGDSPKNWGAAKLKVSKGGSLSAVINGMEKDGWKCVTSTAFNAWRKQNTAQHALHLTPESLAKSQAVSNAETLSQSDSTTPPAQAQVS
jgi:hypothetical protein